MHPVGQVTPAQGRLVSLNGTVCDSSAMAFAARPWPPGESLTDERLAFLAAEPALRKLATPWWLGFLRVFTAGGSANGMLVSPGATFGRDGSGPGGVTQEIRGDRMLAYVVAADIAAQRLSPEERRLLRATGELPAWFLDAVREAHAELKRR